VENAFIAFEFTNNNTIIFMCICFNQYVLCLKCCAANNSKITVWFVWCEFSLISSERLFNIYARTHTHTHTTIYIYIYNITYVFVLLPTGVYILYLYYIYIFFLLSKPFYNPSLRPTCVVRLSLSPLKNHRQAVFSPRSYPPHHYRAPVD